MEYFTVENLVWALFFAILAAILCSCFMQKCLSELAKKLIEKKHDNEDNAATLESLGYKKGIYSAVTAWFAENGNYISKAIVKVKKAESQADSELLFSKKEPVKYYIPEENNNKRLEKHINDSISLPKLAVLIAILVAIAFAASTVIDMLNNYAATLTEYGNDKVIGVTEDETTLLEEQEQANKAEELEQKEKEELEKIEEQARKELEEAQNAALTEDDEMIENINSDISEEQENINE